MRRPIARYVEHATLVGAPPVSVYLPGPGARAEVREYGRRLDAAVKALASDVERTIVSADPDELEAKAATTTDAAEAAALRARASTQRQLATGKAVERIAVERAFAGGFWAFVARWSKFRDEVLEGGFSLSGPSPTQAWTTIETYETELAGWRAKYEALGYQPVAPPPPTPSQVQVEHEDPPNKSAISGVPWGALLGVGGLLAGGYLIGQLARVGGR